MIAVSFIAAFLFLLVVRLVNEANFPLLLNCFGQPGTKWIPFSYTHRRPLRTHYGYINVRTQEVRPQRVAKDSKVSMVTAFFRSKMTSNHSTTSICCGELLWVPNVFCFLILIQLVTKV